MKALMKKHLKNQKGLTLIELLAVVVILGIIAAIAIPSIGAIIDNTRKDAHIANAEQMVNAVKTAKATNVGNGETYTLESLVNSGLIESPKPPKADNYDLSGSTITLVKGTNNNPDDYKITLKAGTKTNIDDKLLSVLRASGGRTNVELN